MVVYRPYSYSDDNNSKYPANPFKHTPFLGSQRSIPSDSNHREILLTISLYHNPGSSRLTFAAYAS